MAARGSRAAPDLAHRGLALSPGLPSPSQGPRKCRMELAAHLGQGDVEFTPRGAGSEKPGSLLSPQTGFLLLPGPALLGRLWVAPSPKGQRESAGLGPRGAGNRTEDGGLALCPPRPCDPRGALSPATAAIGPALSAHQLTGSSESPCQAEGSGSWPLLPFTPGPEALDSLMASHRPRPSPGNSQQMLFSGMTKARAGAGIRTDGLFLNFLIARFGASPADAAPPPSPRVFPCV